MLTFSPTLIHFFSLMIGLIVGSFLNVVIYRLPQKKSVITGRSQCPGCGVKIKWFQNIPIFSFIFLKGRCSSCKKKISIRYPVVELITGLLFLSMELKFGFSFLLIFREWMFVSIVVAITFIDLEHRIIPDILSLGGLLVGLGTSFFAPEISFQTAIIGAFGGFGVFYAMAWIYYRLTNKMGLGGGDIKFLATVGAFLGPLGVLYTVLISSISGTVIGILWGCVNKQKDLMKISIPYGPFLVIGALVYYLFGDFLYAYLRIG